MDEERVKGRIMYARIFSLVLLLYAIGMGVFIAPRIEPVLEMYRVREHIELYLKGEEKVYADIPVVLSTSSSYQQSVRTIERKGRDDLHLAVEALLLDASVDELRKGMLSFIPEGTKLIGIAETDGIVFVDLSKEMLGADYRAYEEIRRTLELNEGPVEVNFMIEGLLINA